MGKLIALLTDFGTSDIYVGVMKGVMKTICPDAEFIDISHHVHRQSVHDGSLMLRNAYRYFPDKTVFLVVIDPTVGSKRRPIIVRAGQYTFIAPDNGILMPVLTDIGTYQAAELSNPNYQLTDGSFTFHGRDIFSPAAAYAARGDVSLSAFGDAITDLIQLPIPDLAIADDHVRGEITHIDHFGNIITNIGTLRWQDDTTLELTTGNGTHLIDATAAHLYLKDVHLHGIKHAYHEVKVGDMLLQVDSNGYLEIGINQGSASERLQVAIHDTITLHLK